MLSLILPALADDPAVDNVGARALGRGSSGLADPGDAGAIQMNLAAASLRPRYELVIGAGIGIDDWLMQRGVAIDSRTTAVALALGYTHWTDDVYPTGVGLPGWYPADEELNDPTDHQGLFLGLAYPFAGRRMSVAVDGRYDWRDSDVSGSSGSANFGLSVAGQPHETLTLALAGKELLDLGYRDTEPSIDFGVRWDPGAVLAIEAGVRSEIVADVGQAIDVSAGIDGILTTWLTLRAGWTWLDQHHYACAGLSLISEHADLDYGMRWQADDFGALRTWHGLDLHLKF